MSKNYSSSDKASEKHKRFDHGFNLKAITEFKDKADFDSRAVNTIDMNRQTAGDFINYIFTKNDYFNTYKIDYDKFNNFLSEMWFHYSKRKNPFHNFSKINI